ncbi:unnamed protein product [Litomosoides sigmodontis]|uniref:Uncharacterized protein n=1 Tax=Litomosoides sigmodontis TaxID=42156 RepID=A0A3P7K4T3_LITSI|nr:unnamed protein product [Litomosoides sigmodontis]
MLLLPIAYTAQGEEDDDKRDGEVHLDEAGGVQGVNDEAVLVIKNMNGTITLFKPLLHSGCSKLIRDNG